jgi:hypothetical protein
MSELELREKIVDIVYITRDTGKGSIPVLTPKEYMEIEDKLVELLNQNKDG